jgi:PII-like signaling protein
MKLPSRACLLRVFIGETDKHGGKPLYELLVELARKRGLAGATAIRGFLGYGANSRVHTSRILRISEDMPVVVEIVDTREKLEAFLPELDGLVSEGLVTMEEVSVIFYRHNAAGKKEAQ